MALHYCFIRGHHYLQSLLREGIHCVEGFDDHTHSQCTLYPVSRVPSLHRICTQYINDTYRGAIYYVVVLCTFAISIPATMHEEVRQSILHQEILKLIVIGIDVSPRNGPKVSGLLRAV